MNQSPGYTLHSSIWLLTDIRAPNSSHCPQEIDVVEQYAGASSPSKISQAQGNLHPFVRRNNVCEKVPRTPEGIVYSSLKDFTTSWQVFRVDWTEDYIAMYINDTLVANFLNKTVVDTYTDNLFIALTACVMERVPVTLNDTFPQKYYVDWVKIYEWV